MIKQESNIANLKNIKDSFDRYIVAPLGNFGFGGFVFHVDRETTINLKADITDNFVEDNTAIQDHMAIRPLRVTLKSYVGELSFDTKNIINDIQQVVEEKLEEFLPYIPELTAQGQQIRRVIAQQEQNLRRISNLFNDLWDLTNKSNPGANEQQKAYLFFKSLMEKKVFVQIQTPFEFLDNMLIEEIIAIQPEESAYISDFSITLKQIKTTSLKTVSYSVNKNQGRGSIQRAELTEIGKVTGVQVEEEQGKSLLSSVILGGLS